MSWKTKEEKPPQDGSWIVVVVVVVNKTDRRALAIRWYAPKYLPAKWRDASDNPVGEFEWWQPLELPMVTNDRP